MPEFVFVDDDATVGRDAAQRKQVTDHPHERAQRRVARVDQTQAPKVEVDGSGNPAHCERFGGTKIDV